MKQRTRWFASALVAVGLGWAGGAALAGPGSGPYGPFNTGGAYGGFGPYAPFVARGLPIQQGLSTAYPIEMQPAATVVTQETRVTRTHGTVRHTEIVAERVQPGNVMYSPINGDPITVPFRTVTNVTFANGNQVIPTEPVGERITTTTIHTWRSGRHVARRSGMTTRHVVHCTCRAPESVGERTGRPMHHVIIRTTTATVASPGYVAGGFLRPEPVGERIVPDLAPTVGGYREVETVQHVGPVYQSWENDYNNVDYDNPYR